MPLPQTGSVGATGLPERSHADFSEKTAGVDLKTWRRRLPVASGMTTQLRSLRVLRVTDERYVTLEGDGFVQVGNADPAHVRTLNVVAIAVGTPQRITNVGMADLAFFRLCTPRFRKETYLKLESDGS